MFHIHVPSCTTGIKTVSLLTAMLLTTKTSLLEHRSCKKIHLEYIYVTNYSELSGEVMMSS